MICIYISPELYNTITIKCFALMECLGLIHLLVGFHTTQSIGDLMQDVKASSSKWINENNLTKLRFEWQSGYGAFSYSKSQVADVIAYIQRQKEHHKKRTFLDEYKLFLENFQVDYNEQFIFKVPE